MWTALQKYYLRPYERSWGPTDSCLRTKNIVRRRSFVRRLRGREENIYCFQKTSLQMWKKRTVFWKKKILKKTNVSCQIFTKMTFCSNEELAEKAKQFPVQYDKSHSYFRRKDIKSNVRAKVGGAWALNWWVL